MLVFLLLFHYQYYYFIVNIVSRIKKYFYAYYSFSYIVNIISIHIFLKHVFFKIILPRYISNKIYNNYHSGWPLEMFSLTVYNSPYYTAMTRRNVGIRGFHRSESWKRVLSHTLPPRPSHRTCSLVWRSYLQTHYFNGALTALCSLSYRIGCTVMRR